ncbi:MAG: thiamine pyrophosphate-binding protein [Betaproteobacteria bacterium]|nr:MAG: thiamine pyrophosphate-binding protein [Betaproteobacteria bacterium]
MLVKTKGRGADALVRALKDAGVTRVFTLSGNHIMSVFDALLDSGIELVHTRHEAAAVHMADAWARVTGEAGVALVTGGPGHANAVSALYTAQMSESPVLLLSGHAPNNQLGLGAFQEMRQAEMAATVTKAAWTSRSANAVAGDIRRGLRIALDGRAGPVNVNLPSDALHGTIDIDIAGSLEDIVPELPALDAGTARALVERLASTARPLILAGPGSATRRGRARLSALEQACMIPAVVMESPRGMADPSLGAFAEVLAQADCVLLLGKRLDFTVKFGNPPTFLRDCEFLQIDSDAEEIERTRRAVGARLKFAALADAAAAIDALVKERNAARPKNGWLAEVNAAVAYRPAEWDSAAPSRPGRVHPVELARPLQAVLDSHPDSVLLADGGEIGQWAQACLHAPHRVINGVGGSIGGGLPFALGARCAESRAPVIAVMGDGTFGFHVAELDTAVTHKLSFVAVVGNDARWNAEYQIQLREYGAERARGCELRELRYDEIAKAFGAWGEHVAHADAMGPAVRRALASGLPACVNVMIEGLAAPQLARHSARS